jgi:glycosyltransferase involved in cell wall biosynthesis
MTKEALDNPQAPEVTVAIVFLNAMPYLPFAVQSVLLQTYPYFELILVDDGSSDGSLQFVQGIRDSRVTITSDGKNVGLAIRLNQAVLAARGRYFVRMDADDIMFPERLATQVMMLRLADEMTVFGAGAVSIDGGNRVLGLRSGAATATSDFAARHQFIHPTVAARTSWFRRTAYAESHIFRRCEDAELWVRTWRHSKFINLVDPLIFYREGSLINVENYVAAGCGVAFLASRTSSGYGRVAWCAFELAKVFAVLQLGHTTARRFLLRHRWAELDPQDVVRYQEKLDSFVVRAARECR